MKRLVFSPAARADLVAIALYIAEDNPDRAFSFVAELEAKAHQAAERPASFPARDDVCPGLRAARHGRYLLFFRESLEEVRIVRVLHGARDLPRMITPGA
ncbi:MAG: type II toxin-antitoxin system RelE/ParE family toxin [Paracraurococcus sp.]